MNVAMIATIRMLLAVLLTGTILWGSAAAQTFPASPVKVLIGIAAGTSPDIVARTVAHAMEPLLGQPMILENRAGAGGTLATTAVAAAPADGYTLNVSGC